jgi:hypothetical protein
VITGDINANVVVINDNGTGEAGNLSGTIDGVAFNPMTTAVAINKVTMILGRGNDSVTYTLTDDTDTAIMRVDAFLNRGNDSFFLNVGSNGFFLNSRYFFRVDGQNGNDIIRAVMQSTTEFFNVGATSSIGMNIRGGNGDDVISFQYSGDNDGLVNFWSDGGDGDDTIGVIYNIFNDPGNVVGRYWAQVYGGDGDNTLGVRIFDFDPDTRDAIIGLIDGGDEDLIAVATTNVLVRNFDEDDSLVFYVPQPVVAPGNGGGNGGGE